MEKRKPRLLFVGAFTLGADGLTGGTLAACRQLMDSPLTSIFDVTTIDVSQPDARSRTLAHRTISGAARLLRVCALVITRRVDVAMIFATVGTSWIERGLMALVCQLFGVQSFLLPRCSEVVGDIEEKSSMRAFTRLLVKSGTRFVFQGQPLKKRFLAVFPQAASHVDVLSNWIDLGWRDSVSPLPTSEPVNILYMGWLHPYKGVDILIEGLARNAVQFGNCRFVLCGDGSERAMLEAAAAQTGLDIEFRGWVHGEAKAKAFSDAQIVILPSRVEGMPNVLLEAMSAGRPVVATKVGDVASLVDDGVEGFLVEPLDPDAFVAALLKLVQDPAMRARFGAAGRAKIERDHDLGKAWRKLADLLGAAPDTNASAAQPSQLTAAK